MGNKAFNHRLPALATACLASGALALVTLSGTTCDFLQINAREGMLLLPGNDVEVTNAQASIGVLCKNGFFERGGDKMWELSFIFLMVSLTLGSMTTALAWAVSTFLPPTNMNWRLLSTLSSLTAVLQVPIFLLFEAEPCSHFRERQYCTLSLGSYFLVASTVFWVAVTLSTQCLDPPLWAIELSAWRVQKRGQSTRVPNRDLDAGERRSRNKRRTSRPSKKSKKKKAVPVPAPTSPPRKWPFSRAEKKKPARGDQHSKSLLDNGSVAQVPASYYSDNIDSQLVLRVEPNGKIAGDEGKSIKSFDDLDSMVEMAEEGRLENSMAMPSGHGVVRVYSHRNDEPPPKASQRSKKPSVETVTIVKSSDGNAPTYVKPSEPSQAKETLKIIGTTNKNRRLDNNTKANEDAQRRKHKTQAVQEAPAAPGDAILADLITEASDGSETDLKNETSETDPYASGIRALTKTLKKDVKRQRSRHRMRRGYAQLDDDYDSDDSRYMTPPFEVSFHMDNMQLLHANDHTTPPLVNDDEEDLIDEWKALHAATTAGFNKGVQECGSFEGDFAAFGSDEPSSPSHHSDPEPVYYSSDETKSETSLPMMEKPPPKHTRDDGDNSTLSSSSGSSKRSGDSGPRPSKSKGNSGGGGSSRGRQAYGRRRRRKHHSPIGSLKSGGSLMGMTIDEETDQDILEESSIGEGELSEAYSITRTKSAPEPRSRGFEKRASRRNRRMVAEKNAAMLMAQEATEAAAAASEGPAVRASGREEKTVQRGETMSNDGSLPSMEDSTPGTKKANTPSTSKTTDFFSGDDSGHNHFGSDPVVHVVTPEQPTPPPRSRSANALKKVTRCLDPTRDHRGIGGGGSNSSRSLSPPRNRRVQAQTFNEDVCRHGGGINVKKAVMIEDDDMSSNQSACSNLSRRAREFRIRRLQRQKQRHGRGVTISRSGRSISDETEMSDDLSAFSAPIPVSTPMIRHDRHGGGGSSSSSNRRHDNNNINDRSSRRKNNQNIFHDNENYLSDSSRMVSDDDIDRMDTFSPMMEDLDLQLIQVRRPLGAEYGDDEASL